MNCTSSKSGHNLDFVFEKPSLAQLITQNPKNTNNHASNAKGSPTYWSTYSAGQIKNNLLICHVIKKGLIIFCEKAPTRRNINPTNSYEIPM